MSSNSNTPSVLITGANGAVGYAVVVHALKAGYKVVAAVRTQSKADTILAGLSVASLPTETKANLSFTIIPDLLDPHAYDNAIKGVDYAIHVASPVPSNSGRENTNWDEELVQPAISGTMNMLEAAERSGSIKRVVITSSVVALIPWAELGAPVIPKVYNEHSRTADPSGPFKSEPEGYVSSKIIALNAAERWLNEKKRNFSVVHVHPALVLGRVELAKTIDEMLSGSSGRAVAQVLGKPAQPGLSNTVWLEDVAEVHVRALDSNIPNSQSLVVSGGAPDGAVWASGREIVQKHFPKAVEKGLLPGWKDGWAETKVWKMDVSETEKLVGMKFEGYEKQLTEIVAHYLEMSGHEVA